LVKKTRSRRAKRNNALKAIKMLRATMIAAAESTYTADEAEFKSRHCKELKDEHAKEFCQKVQKSQVRTGEVNYMTLKGRRALATVCKMQEGLPSCEKSCELEHKFFGEPEEADCDKVRDDWKEECEKRADGELEYREFTEEERA